jgi:hypothetical protein
MRTLKRDLPLTILVDLLVQIVFIVIILWAFDLGTLEAMEEGSKRLSYEDLKRENSELRLENKALRSEIQVLSEKLKELEKVSARQKEKIDQYEQKFGRKGEPDCFGSDLTAAPVLSFRWISGNQVEVKQGANFKEAEKAINISNSVFGMRNADQLAGELWGISKYSADNKCKVRLTFEAPINLPASVWLSTRDSLYALKGIRLNTQYYK